MSLINYAEMARTGNWTLRSALVRLAQPHPALASVVLDQVRRCDGALHPLARSLEAHTVLADRQLDPANLAEAPVEGYPDSRMADIARLVRADPDTMDTVLASYELVAPLDEVERDALPLLLVASGLDQLGALVATWAAAGFEHPPVAEIERLAKSAHDDMERYGIPKERPPSRR